MLIYGRDYSEILFGCKDKRNGCLPPLIFRSPHSCFFLDIISIYPYSYFIAKM